MVAHNKNQNISVIIRTITTLIHTHFNQEGSVFKGVHGDVVSHGDITKQTPSVKIAFKGIYDVKKATIGQIQNQEINYRLVFNVLAINSAKEQTGENERERIISEILQLLDYSIYKGKVHINGFDVEVSNETLENDSVKEDISSFDISYDIKSPIV